MPTPTPVEQFAATLLSLSEAAAARKGWGLSRALMALIANLLREISECFAQLAAGMRDGSFTPSQPAPPGSHRSPSAAPTGQPVDPGVASSPGPLAPQPPVRRRQAGGSAGRARLAAPPATFPPPDRRAIPPQRPHPSPSRMRPACAPKPTPPARACGPPAPGLRAW
jgi:hypothetical protein